MGCGTVLPEGALFCIKCGTKALDTQEKSVELSETTIKQAQPTVTNAVPATNSNPADTSDQLDDLSEFKQYLDEQVRAKTKYQSAQELLECKPTAAKLTWIIMWIGIGMILIGLLFPLLILPALIFLAGGEIGLIIYKMIICIMC